MLEGPKKALADLVLKASNNPSFMGLLNELDKAEARARIAGVHDRFIANWYYEVERARTLPHRGLEPMAVLQITISQRVSE